MSLQNILSEKLILPMSDLLLGREVYTKLKFLEESKTWQKGEIQNFQREMLSKLIKHSYQNVPYYSEVFKSLKLRPDDIREIEDLKKLPILTKKDIRENFPNRIIGQNIPIKHRIPLGSSGSTGEPLRFYITNLSYSLSIATSLRGWYWMGYKLGDKYAKISVNSRSGISKKSQDLVNRCLYLHSKSVSEEDIRNILHKLDKFKPEFIRGYPSTLFLISDYIIKNDIKMIKPKAIATTGEICFGYMRQKIEDAFSSKIYDAYSGEGGATMFEAPDHLSYFIAHEQAITEVIDEDGSEVEEGSGEVVSTNLWNYAVPFIRYAVKDRVTKIKENYFNKNGHFSVAKIEGRDVDILRLPNGKNLIVHFFTGYFESVDSIEQFQVVQNSPIEIELKIIPSIKFTTSDESRILSHIQRHLGGDINVKISKVKEIPFTESGKRRFIIKNF